MKKALLLTLFTAILPAPADALDAKKKTEIIEHLTETYPLPPGIEIELGDPKPSGIPSIELIDVTFKAPQGEQKEKLYISMDGRHYLLGGFKDLGIHPDNDRLAKISLKGVVGRGPEDAKVQVVEYTDFQCFYCRKGYDMMAGKIMKDYKGKVRWIYKSMPLVQIHPWAEPAAVAVECAKDQSPEKLWDLHDLFFENQREVTSANFDDKLREYVESVKLDKKKFNACFDKQETLPRVAADVAEAGAMGISGTPAFLVNGHLISGADYDKLRQTIDEALQGKHGKI